MIKLFISPEELLELVPINVSTDPRIISTTISQVQKLYYKHIIGAHLYNDLMSLIDGTEFPPAYEQSLRFISSTLKDYLAYKTASVFFNTVQYRAANSGFTKPVANGTQHADACNQSQYYDNLAYTSLIQGLHDILEPSSPVLPEHRARLQSEGHLHPTPPCQVNL